MKKVIAIALILLTLCGCKELEEKTSELDEILASNNYIIVDVRTKEEYSKSHIKDSINIPYTEITEDINLDKEKTILVYCQSGARSNIAYQKLSELGFKVYDMGAYDKINMEKVN